jgi:replicative DNA helicase
METLVVNLMDRVQEMADNPNDITGVPTGFYDLDRMTSGLQAGDLVVLAARPSMGKTAFAINIAEHVALNEGLPVAVFSMEMGAAQLAVRVVGSIGRIDQGHLRTGKLTDEEWPRLTDAIERLRTVSLHIDETPGLTPSELRANARRLARRCGKLGLIVVDYLQLMSGSSGSDGDNRATELGEISRGLKMLAKELQCPVIALSQLNRGVEQRTDKRPMMSDLRESGAIEQDADIIMFIYRDDYYNKDSKEPGIAEIIIGKQRNGPTGAVRLTFLKPLTRFESLAPGSHGDF